MIITLKQNAAAEEVSRLRGELEAQGFVIHPVEGTRYNILGLIGDTASLDARQIESLDFVDKVTRIQEPYKKANRKFHPADSVRRWCIDRRWSLRSNGWPLLRRNT